MKASVFLTRNLNGQILDLGGGGEGVIGRIYREQVIAIDNRQDELDEAPDGFDKRLMDAANLLFDDAVFDAVTAFFSLMYFPQDTLEKAVSEAFRVLKPCGVFCVWDAPIQNADPFIIELDINAAGIPIHTTYGVYLDNKTQTNETIQSICRQVGFRLIREEADDTFYLCFQK